MGLPGGVQLIFLALLGIQLASARIIKRDTGNRQLFAVGEEYKFNYEVLITTGTEIPVSHAASYRLKGLLRVQGTTSNTITVKLENLGIGLFNGQWSYFPVPSVEYISTEDLNALSEPFQIVFENGKFKTLLMNDQEPEWASNMKRGLGTYLQMNMERVTPQKLMFFKDEESTTMGLCPTMYEVMPITATGMGLARVSKFRNHADCPDVPVRFRHESRSYYRCSDDQTRDIMNSTSYAIYDLSVQGAKITVQKLTVLSSILYWPFTQNGPFMYSWYNMTLALDNVGPIASAIPPPENVVDHEDLTYVFEQSDYTDPEEDISDLKGVEPMFFHQTSAETEPEVLDKIMENCHQTIASLARSMLTAEVFDDVDEFHRQTPTAVIPFISSLDYDYLTRCFNYFSERAGNSEQESLELQVFLDGLANSGTPAASLVARDILKATDDIIVIGRLISALPNSIRHPSEALGNELDSIFELVNRTHIEPRVKGVVELAMATIVSRSCKKTLCQSSGLLEKYINYFEGKLSGSNWEDQVSGILGLANLGLGRALEKPFEIAQGLHPEYENVVRIQSVWSLWPIVFEQRDRVLSSLLPVFFNRSESCETRSSIFSLLMGSQPDERVLHEIAYFMWSETCPQTMNVVRSTLALMANTEYPCNPMRSYARTVAKYLPPGEIDILRTATYASDYYDKTHGFGRMTYVRVQKTGTSVIPLSIFVSLKTYVGGFSNSFYGIYLRLQGVDTALRSQLPDVSTGNVEKVIEILSKLEIDERSNKPLRIEFVMIHGGKTVEYIAADETSFALRLRSIITSMQLLRQKFTTGDALSMQNPYLTGGIRYQQPLEIGTPISIFANNAALTAYHTNVTKTTNAAGTSQTDTDSVYQFNTFGTTGVSNHIPAINTVLSVAMRRSFRLRIPSHTSTSSQAKPHHDKLQFNLFTPKANNPLVAMIHATTEVSLTGDVPNGIADEEAEARLHQSCPACVTRKTVTRGDSFRRERDLALPSPKLLRGVTAKVKYMDCERDHSKAALLKKLGVFFSDSGKNPGHFSSSLAKLALGLDQTMDTLSLAPYGETCGLKAVFAQDPSATTMTTKISGTLSKQSSKTQPKVQVEASFVLSHEGTENSETKVDLQMTLKDTKQSSSKQQQIQIKGAVLNGPGGESGMLCLDFDSRLSTSWDDPLAFTGESEPSINQTVSLKLGKFPSGQPSPQSSVQDLACLNNHADVIFTGDAQRSQDQVAEAEAASTWPYNQCLGDKASSLWPGKFVPPTRACELVMMEQTSLRSANLSLSYKVAKEARKRWGVLTHLCASFLSPFLVEPDSFDHVHTDRQHNHRVTTSAAYITGDVEINLELRKNSPQMNMHYIKNGEDESHFANVDLSLLPGLLVPRPFYGRVSPLQQFQRLVGASGSCSISTVAVLTLDSFVFPISLSSDCSVLVSGDCNKKPQYAILARQMPNQQLAVIVQVQDIRIELQNPNTAVIDGAVKTFRNYEEFEKAGKFLMYTRKDEIYVAFATSPITVRYTGSFLTVDLGPIFRGLNCGLCGNWDKNPYNDIAGPKTCSRPLTPGEIVQAWIVREGQCTDVGQSCPES